MNEEELKELAANLRLPKGDYGVEIGNRMQVSNANIIRRSFASADIQQGENILEIGPGNGAHLMEIGFPEISFTGVDMSADMVDECRNLDLPSSFHFEQTDGKRFAFFDASFDKVITVNTLYFWENPKEFAVEIHRVLKPGGAFFLGFVDKESMEKLPFTAFGFHLYTKSDAASLLESAGFSIGAIHEETETLISNAGFEVQRTIFVIRAKKP